MARPGFRQHLKLKRLAHLLKLPLPYAWGLCECLWDTAYQSGNPFIGDSVDVELAAEYPGEPGTLTKSLLAVGLIDEVEPGKYQIHDLHENAPEFVKKRFERDQHRKNKYTPRGRGKAEENGISPTNSGNSPTNSDESGIGLPNSGIRQKSAELGSTHSTAQDNTPPTPPTGGGRGCALDGFDPLFIRFWKAYPNKVARVAAARVWDELRVDEELLAIMLRAIDEQKKTDIWLRGKVPKPDNWLRDQRWTDTGLALDEPRETPAELAARLARQREEDNRQRAIIEEERAKRNGPSPLRIMAEKLGRSPHLPESRRA